MGNGETKITTYGYRIIKVAQDSPAKKAGLVEFLDYIIDISSPTNDVPFSGNYGEFFKIIQNSEDQETTLKVYNILYRKTRIVTIVPSKKWENADSLLGALVRYEEYASAFERVLRISTVYENSPAAAAGLVPDTDYILGSPQYLYTDLNELSTFIEMTQENETIKSLELYVYSAETNTVRSTLIIPNKNWGGQGYLGCEFALGFLNHLPQLEDNMHVSTFASDTTDRLDADTTDKTTDTTLNENKAVEKHEEPGASNIEKIDESEPEKQVDTIPEIKPPTNAELNKSRSLQREPSHDADHGHDISDQKAKLLHLAHPHKISVKSIAKPFIKPGNSSANPFQTSENFSASQGEVEQSQQTAATENNMESSVHSVVEKIKEEVKAVQEKIVHHGEEEKTQLVEKPVEKETVVVSQTQDRTHHEQPKHAARPHTESSEERQEKEASKDIATHVQQQEVKVEGLGQSQRINGEPISPEKRGYKTKIEYNFFSKKLNKDYKIESMNLFDIEELEHQGQFA